MTDAGPPPHPTTSLRYRAGPMIDADVDDEVFLVDPASSESYRLNPSAATVWRALVGGASVDEAADALAGPSDADPAVVHADVIAVVERLVELGALVTTHDPPEPDTDRTRP